MFRLLRLRLARLGLFLAVTLGMTLVLAPAQANASPILDPHPTCVGSLVPPTGGHDWYVGSTKMGTLYVYYSNANGGTNCLWFQKNYHRGTATSMYMDIGVCGSTPSSSCTVRDSDSGNFKYYAGRVIATGTANRCIDSFVRIEEYTHYFGPFHCG
jgi:hypothetical protein